MATYTAGDQINRALRLLGVLAEGETPSASESADALMALNQMLDSWSTERLSVFSTSDQTFTWPAGQVTRTLGPTGDFVGVRPVLLDDSTYYVDSLGVSHQIQIINEDQYNAIAVKTVNSSLPQFLYVNATNPDIEMSLYPVPSQALTWHFVGGSPLAEPVSLATTLAFPPGYMRAFAYNLAMEIAPEFGVEPSQDVRRTAMISKRNLKRINNPDDVMSMPINIVGGMRFNINTGY